MQQPEASVLPSAAGIREPDLHKIGLEEHFIIPEFVDYLASTKENINSALFDKVIPILADFGERRLSKMQEGGIDYVVLSLAGPGVQIEPDKARAVKLAQYCNDFLAERIHENPAKFGGFAHLAMQDPACAADELSRCVTALGFKGAMINGQTNGVYLDDGCYDVFWERVEALRVPIYIHPGNPVDFPKVFEGHPEMWGPVWSWAVETCSHAMRLVFSGVFDRFPDAHIILGHMGETLPMQLWRLDSRLPISNFRGKLARKPSEYFRRNIYVTTSGVCADAPLRCAVDALGIDNVMFSVDYPFEDTNVAAEWIATCSAVSQAERIQIASGNARRILRL